MRQPAFSFSCPALLSRFFSPRHPFSISLVLSLFLALTLLTPTGPAHAQGNTASADKTARSEAIQKLLDSWNAARDRSDIDAMLALVLPDERELARDYIKPKAKGNSKVKVVSITSAGDRMNVTLERSWSGQQPGKGKWVVQVSEFAGAWYIRFPGGDLKSPKNVAAPVPASALSAPAETDSDVKESAVGGLSSNTTSKSSGRTSNTIKPSSRVSLDIAKEVAPYEEGKVSDSRADVKTLAPTPPRPMPGVEKFQNWTRVCELNTKGQVDCLVEQIITKPSNKQLFFIWRMTPDGNGKITSNVITPNRVMLPPGVEMQFGREKPLKAAYRVCNEKTCELFFNTDIEVMKTAAENGSIRADFVNHNGAKIEFDIPVKGLMEALTGI